MRLCEEVERIIQRIRQIYTTQLIRNKSECFLSPSLAFSPTASRSLQDAYESYSHLLCDSIISVELSLSIHTVDTPYLFAYKALHALESYFTLPVSNWCVLWLWSHSYPSCCSWFIVNFSCSQRYTKYIFMISILILDKIEL